jgi:hypothetical protein
VPLTLATPAHPQIVIALGNSESMDGNLSGAIMTGSGSLSPARPNWNVCSGGGSAYLMVLNFATGAAFPLPELDVTVDGKLDLSDVPSSGNMPVGMRLGPVCASTPALLPFGSGLGGTHKLTSLSSGTVDSVLDRGRAKQRISWWEVRQ